MKGVLPLVQVRTKLAHPTNYHVSAIQKRQVSQYLSSQTPHYASHSAPTQHNSNFPPGGVPGHAGNMTSFSVRKDPMLSGIPSVSPQQRSPVGTYDGGHLNIGGSPSHHVNIGESPSHHVNIGGSPSHHGMLMTGSPSGMYVGGQPQSLALRPESPTSMMTSETPENVSHL